LIVLDFLAFRRAAESRGLARVCAPGLTPETRLRPSLAPDAPMCGGIVSGGHKSHYAFVENGAEICRLTAGGPRSRLARNLARIFFGWP